MSLDVFDHDDGRFRLVRDGREIGSIEGRTIRFHAYADVASATLAAATAYDALARWTARQLRSAPLAHDGRRLAIVPEDGVEWLVLGAARIGRLWRRAPDDAIERASAIGFEIDLPTRLPASLALSAAHVMDLALNSGGRVTVPASQASPPNAARAQRPAASARRTGAAT
jgi:hypothetical protein